MPFACSVRYTVTHRVLTKADRLINVDTSVAKKDTGLRQEESAVGSGSNSCHIIE